MKFYRTMPAGLKVYYRQQLENYRSEMSKANLQLACRRLEREGFRHVVTKYFSLSTHYDSDMGLGAGITITC